MQALDIGAALERFRDLLPVPTTVDFNGLSKLLVLGLGPVTLC